MTVHVSRVSQPYWDAIPQDEREAIEAAVPEGHRLVIVPGHRAKPGTADIQLRTLDNQSAGPVSRGYITAARCWAVLPRRTLPDVIVDPRPRVVVTTDADGWVTSIEDAP